MRIYVSLVFALLIRVTASSQVFAIDLDTDERSEKYTSGKRLLQHMHKKYGHGYCKNYTFSQKNTHYRHDSVVGHSEWYEAIEFPDKFRIDFGDKSLRNFVIFKNDSSYSYRGGKFLKAKYNSNSLLLLLGGMYYRDYNEVLARLGKEHYNTDIISEQVWNGAAVYVIGAAKGDSLSNQFWIDQKTWRIMRIIEKINDKETMDMRFESHQKLCNGYVETKVSFRRNGQLEQVEDYDDIKPVDAFPADIFTPK